MTSRSLGFFMIRFTIAFPKAKVNCFSQSKSILPKVNIAESALSGMLEEQCRFLVGMLLFVAMKVTFGTVIYLLLLSICRSCLLVEILTGDF
jgi:hypothetical protein